MMHEINISESEIMFSVCGDVTSVVTSHSSVMLSSLCSPRSWPPPGSVLPCHFLLVGLDRLLCPLNSSHLALSETCTQLPHTSRVCVCLGAVCVCMCMCVCAWVCVCVLWLTCVSFSGRAWELPTQSSCCCVWYVACLSDCLPMRLPVCLLICQSFWMSVSPYVCLLFR